MFKDKSYLYIFLFSGFFAILDGLLLRSSLNIFFSWFMLGFWVMFTVKFFKTIRYYRELNSPFNTLIFVLVPILIGLLYNFWGYYTGLFEYSLIQNEIIGLSIWNLVFATPYLLFGIYSLYACFKNFQVVYIFRSRSVNSKIMGYFLFVFLLVNGILILALNVFLSQIDFFLEPTTLRVDLSLIIIILLSIIVFIKYGLFYEKRSLSELSPELMEDRMRSIERRARTQPRTSYRSRSSSRTKSKDTTVPSSKKTKRKRTRRPTRKKIYSARELEKYRPAGSLLSPEDFKCIFCWEFPKLPDDEGRGIVVCPKCKRPAHTDEFKDWARSSKLCSRCNAPLPQNFLKNPKVIPIKEYRRIVKAILKREKKK